jgi:hypothetical protein
VKSRGILFNARSIRAILGGSKTQTRRIANPVPLEPRNARSRFEKGQVLWVREAWRARDGDAVEYAADLDEPVRKSTHWSSPLFLPRRASRIDLGVLDVRIERLQDISERDARAEGAEPAEAESARDVYARMWDAVNEKRAPWSSNPWVWVIEFRRTKPS